MKSVFGGMSGNRSVCVCVCVCVCVLYILIIYTSSYTDIKTNMRHLQDITRHKKDNN